MKLFLPGFAKGVFQKGKIICQGFVLLAVVIWQLPVQAQTALSTPWITNGRLHDLAVGNGKIFTAGDGDWFGEPFQTSVAVFNSNLSHDTSWPAFNDNFYYDAISDDEGGIFAVSYDGVTHIKADKSVEKILDANNPYSVIKVGNILYVGGPFTTVNTLARKYAAAYDLVKKELTAFDPNPSSYVYCFYHNGTKLYAGGSFTTIGGQTRNKLAELDPDTGVASSFNANINGTTTYVYTMQSDAANLYIGGLFSNVNFANPAHPNLAALNPTTGALVSAFNPRPDASVQNLLLDGTTLYVTGNITKFNTTSKKQIGAVTTSTGALLPFDLKLDDDYNSLNTIALDGQHLLVTGYIRTLDGISHGNFVAVDKVSGSIASDVVARNVSGQVYSIVVKDGKIFTVGSIDGVTGINRSNTIFSLDGVTGHANPGFNAELPVLATGEYSYETKIYYYNGHVYYLRTNSNETTDFGALDPTTGAAIDEFAVQANGNITEVTFGNNNAYFVGDFDQVGGENRYGFAAVDVSTGKPTAWQVEFSPNSDNRVSSLGFANNTVYAAGRFYFSNQNGDNRENLIAFNATTGELTPWAPVVDLPDYGDAIIGAIENGKVYLIGPVCRRVDAVKGEPDGWEFDNGDGAYYETMAVSSNAVFVGGGFSPGLLSLDKTTAELTTVQPLIKDVYESEASVNALATNGVKLFVGGSMSYQTSIDSRSYYAEFLLDNSGNQPPVIDATAVSVTPGKIITIPLASLISDPDGNLDITTLKIISPPSSGAVATIDANYNLVLDYTGVTLDGVETLVVEVCDTEDACTQQEISLETGGELEVYNGISPNGDGKNETFYVNNIDVYPASQNKLSIFNRWGDVVFEAENYDNTTKVFRGISTSGNELPAGVYFYKIVFTNGDKARTGYLSLKR